MRTEIQTLTDEIKKTLGCEKIAANAYIADIEEKCNDSNKLGIDMYLMEGDNEWIARTNKVITDDCEVTHYYWFNHEPTKDEIEFAEWLADIYNEVGVGQALGLDWEANQLKSLKDLRAKLDKM